MSILSVLKGTFALKDELRPDVRLASAPPPPPPPTSRVQMTDVTAPPPPPKAQLASTGVTIPEASPPPQPPPVADVELPKAEQAQPEPEHSPEDVHQEGMEQLADSINEAVERSAAEAGAEIDSRTESVTKNPDAKPEDSAEVSSSGTETKREMEEALREVREKNKGIIDATSGTTFEESRATTIEDEPEQKSMEEAVIERQEENKKIIDAAVGEVSARSGATLIEDEPSLPESDKGDEAVEAMNEGGDEAPAEQESPEKKSRSVAEILQEEFTDGERADLDALRSNENRTSGEERRYNELRDKLETAVFGAPSVTSKSARPERVEANREGSVFEEDEELTRRLEETRAAYERARDTARPLASASEREELIQLLHEKMSEMSRIREQATGLGNELSRLAAEGRVAELRSELDELEKPPGWMGRFRDRARDIFNKAKETGAGWLESIRPSGRGSGEKPPALPERTSKARGFLWERIKGIGGFYEALQWEKLRRGTKEVAAEISEREGTIWTEQMLQEQVDLMARDQGYENMDPDERGKLLKDIELSFLAPMRERNEKRINEIVHVAMENYRTKLAKVRRAMTGESAVSEENLARVETRIRERLTAKSKDLMGKHVTDYRRELRRLADPKWNWRLGFAGIQAVLAGLGIGYIGGKVLEGGAAAVGPTGTEGVSGSAPVGPETIPSPTVPPEMTGAVKEQFVRMHQNVWTSVKTLAQQQAGIMLPDSQIMEISRQVLVDNGMYESNWLMEQVGQSARALPESMELNFTKLPAAMKSALGILR